MIVKILMPGIRFYREDISYRIKFADSSIL